MLVYIIATCLTVILTWFAVREKQREGISLDNEKKTGSKKLILLCVLSMIPLLFVSAVRWNVGTDTWHTYTSEYLSRKADLGKANQSEKDIVMICGQVIGTWNEGGPEGVKRLITYEEAQGSFSSGYNHTTFGFRALEELLLFLNADVQWLYVITSVIIMTFSFATIWQQSEAPVFAVLLFVITGNFFLSLNVVSQYMAIAICLFACKYAQNRKPIQFFVLIALAACFHISALIFVPVYFLPKLKIRPIWCAGIIAAAFVFAQFGYSLLEKLISVVAPAYTRYLGSGGEFEWIFLALDAAVFVVGTYYFKAGENKPYYRLWYYMNVLGIIALCFSGRIPYMKRINYYFAAPHFLFLPLVLSCEKNEMRQKIYKGTLIALYIAETIVAVAVMNKNGVLPYQFFFQGDRVEMTRLMLQHLPGKW